jgi:hypothetical protein
MRTLFTAILAVVLVGSTAAQSDLDALMQQVLSKRDENWKKLQQYVLDEREVVELRGPSKRPIWGEHREYTWYIRNGFFVRSPVKVNGAAVGDADRQKYEAEYLKRAQRREGRADDATLDESGILAQARQPKFISSSYFLRFKFEPGNYALVGKETLDGRDVLRIEYYPQRLFTGTDRRRHAGENDRAYDEEFRRLMNKVALVTLWIEPTDAQIVKYTFDNVALDFLPAQWLLHVDDVKASMNMSQPFPGVWLPRDVDVLAAMSLVSGQFEVHYGLEYHDYRQADVATKIKIP